MARNNNRGLPPRSRSLEVGRQFSEPEEVPALDQPSVPESEKVQYPRPKFGPSYDAVSSRPQQAGDIPFDHPFTHPVLGQLVQHEKFDESKHRQVTPNEAQSVISSITAQVAGSPPKEPDWSALGAQYEQDWDAIPYKGDLSSSLHPNKRMSDARSEHQAAVAQHNSSLENLGKLVSQGHVILHVPVKSRKLSGVKFSFSDSYPETLTSASSGSGSFAGSKSPVVTRGGSSVLNTRPATVITTGVDPNTGRTREVEESRPVPIDPSAITAIDDSAAQRANEIQSGRLQEQQDAYAAATKVDLPAVGSTAVTGNNAPQISELIDRISNHDTVLGEIKGRLDKHVSALRESAKTLGNLNDEVQRHSDAVASVGASNAGGQWVKRAQSHLDAAVAQRDAHIAEIHGPLTASHQELLTKHKNISASRDALQRQLTMLAPDFRPGTPPTNTFASDANDAVPTISDDNAEQRVVDAQRASRVPYGTGGAGIINPNAITAQVDWKQEIENKVLDKASKRERDRQKAHDDLEAGLITKEEHQRRIEKISSKAEADRADAFQRSRETVAPRVSTGSSVVTQPATPTTHIHVTSSGVFHIEPDEEGNADLRHGSIFAFTPHSAGQADPNPSETAKIDRLYSEPKIWKTDVGRDGKPKATVTGGQWDRNMSAVSAAATSLLDSGRVMHHHPSGMVAAAPMGATEASHIKLNDESSFMPADFYPEPVRQAANAFVASNTEALTRATGPNSPHVKAIGDTNTAVIQIGDYFKDVYGMGKVPNRAEIRRFLADTGAVTQVGRSPQTSVSKTNNNIQANTLSSAILGVQQLVERAKRIKQDKRTDDGRVVGVVYNTAHVTDDDGTKLYATCQNRGRCAVADNPVAGKQAQFDSDPVCPECAQKKNPLIGQIPRLQNTEIEGPFVRKGIQDTAEAALDRLYSHVVNGRLSRKTEGIFKRAETKRRKNMADQLTQFDPQTHGVGSQILDPTGKHTVTLTSLIAHHGDEFRQHLGYHHPTEGDFVSLSSAPIANDNAPTFESRYAEALDAPSSSPEEALRRLPVVPGQTKTFTALPEEKAEAGRRKKDAIRGQAIDAGGIAFDDDTSFANRPDEYDDNNQTTSDRAPALEEERRAREPEVEAAYQEYLKKKRNFTETEEPKA